MKSLIHAYEPRSTRGSLAYVAVAIAAVAIGGCGGSARSSGKAAATRPDVAAKPAEAKKAPAEARFISRADKICERLDVVLNAEGLAPKSASRQEAVKLAGVRAGFEQRAVTELRRLKVPRSFSARWREILRLRTSLAHELSEYGRAATAGDQSTISALTKSKAKVHEELAAIGSAAGFKVCSAVH